MSIDDIVVHPGALLRCLCAPLHRMRRAGAAAPGSAATLGSVAALGLAAGLTWLDLAPNSDPEPVEAPVVSAEVLARALASTPPFRPTMTDEIDHFRARLASNGGEEAFSRRRLTSAHLLRFRAYGASQDLNSARTHLSRLLASREAAPELLSLTSSLRLLEHDFPAALETARAANEATRDFDSALRLRLFDALWATGASEQAAALLELPHDRGSFDYLVREARVLDGRGDPAAARDRLAAALEVARAYAEPRAVEAWALTELGHFEHHSGHPERARERYLEATRTLPGYPAAIEGLANLAWGVDREPWVAHALFAHALRAGGHIDLYPVLAETAAEMGRPERAEALRLEFVDRATRTPEETRQYLRPLALVLADHHPERLDDAIRFAERDLEMRPTAGSWATLAWVRYRAGDVEAAWTAVREAIAWGAPSPEVLFRAGVVADEAGHRERAVELLETAREGASELSLAELREIERRLGRT